MQQIKSLHKSLYQIARIDETEYSEVAYKRKELLEKYKRLDQDGCSQETILEVLGMSRATYYRWKKNYEQLGLAGLENESRRPNKIRKPAWHSTLETQVINLRRQHKFYGKGKIAALLRRDFKVKASVSTVGRIISKNIKSGKVKSVSFYCGWKNAKPRIFNGHAKRIPKGAKAVRRGELIQVDHMDVNLHNGSSVKHFKAICPITKFVVEQAYTRATSQVAAEFLQHAIKSFPFPIVSIQVDGGSEFMGDFERGCQVHNIPLYVLPPRSPEQNGSVERCNGTVKYEFYYQYSGPTALHILRKSLEKYVNLYNSFRPHQALGYLTPLEYCKVIDRGIKSHMY